MPRCENVCEAARLPEPPDSLIPAALDVVSPQSTVAVCVSFVPGSVNVAPMLTGAVCGTSVVGALTVPSVGATFATVTCAFEITGALNWSRADIVAVTTASSLHVIVGVSVVVPVGTQTVPGPPEVLN